MKDKLQNLAGGYGEIKRSVFKIEFGTLVLEPCATIGKHDHKDEGGFRHCEIYFSLSPHIRINGRKKKFAVCRNSSHFAKNDSRRFFAKIVFVKIWW